MIGEKLGGYIILESLGTGTMGTVYKAEDLAGQGIVAVKLVKSQVLYDREKRERFLQGLLVMAELKHSNICPILEIGDENDDFYVVTPFLAGVTLKKYLERSPLSWQRALDISLEVGEALAVGHAAGAVHRGLKPANIWLRADGSVVVNDFNLARFTEIDRRAKPAFSKPRIAITDTIIPTAALAYMSPEQVRGEPVDHRTDVFSFGVLLYEMLTGHHPFESRNSLSRMSAILNDDPTLVSARGTPLPAELDPILRKALAKLPGERYQTMSSLLSEIRWVREHGTPVAAPANFAARAPLKWARSRWLAILTLVIALLAIFTSYLLRG